MNNLTKAIGGKLILTDKDYKMNGWMIVLVFALLFVPLVNLFDLLYLLPKVIMDNSIRKTRVKLYENIQDKIVTNVQSNGQLYRLNDSNATPVEDNTLMYHQGCDMYKLVLLNILGLFVQLFISSLAGVIIYGVIGYLANTYGMQQAENMVLKEVTSKEVTQVHFPNGETLNINLKNND